MSVPLSLISIQLNGTCGGGLLLSVHPYRHASGPPCCALAGEGTSTSAANDDATSTAANAAIPPRRLPSDAAHSPRTRIPRLEGTIGHIKLSHRTSCEPESSRPTIHRSPAVGWGRPNSPNALIAETVFVGEGVPSASRHTPGRMSCGTADGPCPRSSASSSPSRSSRARSSRSTPPLGRRSTRPSPESPRLQLLPERRLGELQPVALRDRQRGRRHRRLGVPRLLHQRNRQPERRLRVRGLLLRLALNRPGSPALHAAGRSAQRIARPPARRDRALEEHRGPAPGRGRRPCRYREPGQRHDPVRGEPDRRGDRRARPDGIRRQSIPTTISLPARSCSVPRLDSVHPHP